MLNVLFNKLTSVFNASVLLLIIHELRHNIVRVAESADYFDNVMTQFMINNRTDALKTDVDLFFTIKTGQMIKCRLQTWGNALNTW